MADLSPELEDIHRFAGNVLGLPLPPLHRFFSPIVQASARTEKLLKDAMRRSTEIFESTTMSPIPLYRARRNSQRNLLDVPNKESGSGRRISIVEGRRKSNWKKEGLGSEKPPVITIVAGSSTPVIIEPLGKPGDDGELDHCETYDTLSTKTRSFRSNKPQFHRSKYLSPQLLNSTRVLPKEASRVKMLSTLTVISPVFAKKPTHLKSKSESCTGPL